LKVERIILSQKILWAWVSDTDSYALFYPPFESYRYPNIILKCPLSDFIKALVTNLPD